MKPEADVFDGMQDKIKTHLGGEATYCFLFTAPIVVAIQIGWRSLFTLKAGGFILVGMFASAIVLGNAAYWTYYFVLSGHKTRYENGKMEFDDIFRSMRQLGGVLTVGLLAGSAACAWFVWKWLNP